VIVVLMPIQQFFSYIMERS